MIDDKYLHSELSESIIKGYFHVYNALGYGFLEKVYENALAITLRRMGFQIRQQAPIPVRFEGQVVGEYFADLIVNDLIIIELKSAESLHSRFEAQLINYLRATSYEIGLLLNFGEKPEFKRRVFMNSRKSRAPDG